MDPNDFQSWLRSAKYTDQIVYFVGSALAEWRGSTSRKPAAAVAAQKAYADGLVVLLQRHVSQGERRMFEYIAVRTKKKT